MAYDQATVAAIVSELRAAGASDNAIRGVLANVKDESGFDPGLRHPDQPRWGGEAHYAHGLYQEGGQEWNNYTSWLNQNAPGADWRDPTLQTRFLAQNLKSNYAPVWNAMNNGTGEQAAQNFVSGYLKPAENFRLARMNAYGGGVPELSAYGNLQPQPLGPGTDTELAGHAGALAGVAGLTLPGLSDPATSAAASAVSGATSGLSPMAMPQTSSGTNPGSVPNGLFGALGIDTSNIGGTGASLTQAGLNIPGLGTISGGTTNAPQISADSPPPPMSLTPQRKPIDMRGIYALTQQRPLGILTGI